MLNLRLTNRLVVGLIFALIVLVVLFFLGLCTKSSSIEFLPARAGAEWIVYPRPADASRHAARPNAAVFERSFVLSATPTQAELSLMAFKTCLLSINGNAFPMAKESDANWKSPMAAEVRSLLKVGTNQITVAVTNYQGPPALWLCLKTDALMVGTDATWGASLTDGCRHNARLAILPPELGPGNLLHGGERMADSLKRAWPTLACLGALSIGMVLLLSIICRSYGLTRDSLSGGAARDKTKTVSLGLLLLVLLARAALFFNNLNSLPPSMGFDAEAHGQYIEFIQQRHALPRAADGLQMFQPPLYYLAGVALLDVFNLSMQSEAAVPIVRGLNGVIGLAHCWVIWLCLRMLFPGNLSAQAAGLLLAAFVPPHLYLSQYVTNEPMAGFFATLSLYFCLRVLQQDGESTSLYFALGLALGLALLSRITPVLMLPSVFLALGFRLISRREHRLGVWIRCCGTVLLSCLLVCGWQYGRALLQSGGSVLPNWEKDTTAAWWQYPGLRTREYYVHFGQCFISPLFSGIQSFADGIYSTLWGDGLVGGASRLAFRPPWNYDLMNVGIIAAIVPSLLLGLGFVRAARTLVGRGGLERLIMLGSFFVLGLGVIYISLRGPWLAAVKAFHAFSGLLPFTALFVLGWDWVGKQSYRLHLTLWTFLVFWCLTTYAAFWIRTGNPETHQVRGLYFVEKQREAEALQCFSRALQLDAAVPPNQRLKPDNAEVHFNLALLFAGQNRMAAAVEHYQLALRARPDFPGALNNLAWILAANADPQRRAGREAVNLAERAVALTGRREALYLGTLAAAYAEAGRFDDAVAAAELASRLAAVDGQSELAETNRQLLERYRSGRPYHEELRPEPVSSPDL